MSRLSFDTAETLVYDPVSTNRNATRASLYSIGFRRIETVGTIDAFVECMRRRPPDLALCEAQGTDIPLCNTIQSLRLGLSTYNPFVVIIVTAWEQSNALVSRVLHSGADDLLLRPFSTTTLNSRIRIHIERRKGFVITSDYVGPDRRSNGSRPSNIDLFEPPNSLRMKAQERLTSEEATQRLDRELKRARELLTSEKLRRDAFQLCVLWRLMQAESPASQNFEVDLMRMRDVARGIARRCIDTEFEAGIAWCESIVSALDGMDAGVDRAATMHLFGHAAVKLVEMFSPERSAEDHLAAVDATVEIVRARMAPKLAS